LRQMDSRRLIRRIDVWRRIERRIIERK